MCYRCEGVMKGGTVVKFILNLFINTSYFYKPLKLNLNLLPMCTRGYTKASTKKHLMLLRNVSV